MEEYINSDSVVRVGVEPGASLITLRLADTFGEEIDYILSVEAARKLTMFLGTAVASLEALADLDSRGWDLNAPAKTERTFADFVQDLYVGGVY